MNGPPKYPTLWQPSDPHWRNWALFIVLLSAVPFVALLALWPEAQPRQQLWQWSAVAPLCGALALAVRMVGWNLALFEVTTHRQTRAAATQRWWQRQRLALPVQQVLLLGPASDEQASYRQLMAVAPTPLPVVLPASGQAVLRSAVSLSSNDRRPEALARDLARQALTLPDIDKHWPALRGIAWAGCADSLAAFEKALAAAGAVLPAPRMPLNNLAELDVLIEAFARDCRSGADWLLCAGVASLEHAGSGELPGEGGFVWWVGWHGRALLHRGEYLLSDAGESAAQACAQLQGYAGLDAAPAHCVALGPSCQGTFVGGGWPVAEHQVAAHWGNLGGLAPFIGMSLALLQAGESRQACGWLSQCDEQQPAIGMAVPYGE